jgi:ureidoacrylate peracid hydrolase
MLATLKERLEARHSALLVIDMQNDFCAEGGYVEKVIGRNAAACRAIAADVAALVADARAAKVPVVWVVADYSFDKVTAGMRVKALERGTEAVCCAPGSWGAAFLGAAPTAGETVITKHCYSGFMGTPLDAHLRGLGARTLVFAGVQTNVCVESTLRDGASLGFHIVVARDCVASHMQPAHEGTLQAVSFLFGDVLGRRDIAAHWAS